MAYIGKTPTSGDFVLLDSITTSATASYTMQKNSVNFTPQSANHMIVSLNGTIQAPVNSFTVSGSTLTFASALTSSDVIDFVLVLGNVNDVGVASSVVDSAITKNKTDFITDGSSAGVTVKGSGSDSGSIALNCSSNSHAIQLISPDHSAGQSYKLKLPDNNVTADKFIKVKSITGSGATATGQLEFADAGGVSTLLYEATVTGETGGSDDYNDSTYFAGGTYDRFRVYIDQFEPASDGTNLLLQLKLGGVLRTNNYEYHTKLFQSNSDSAVNRSTGTSGIRIIDDVGTSGDEHARCWFEYTARETQSDSRLPQISYHFTTSTSGNNFSAGWGGGQCYDSTGTLSGFRLIPTAGALGDYIIRIYGMKS